jgi:Domain of unknown function (DUF1963)
MTPIWPRCSECKMRLPYGWCRRPLTTLFACNLLHPQLHMLRDLGTHLRIVTCERCTCYGPIYTDIDGKGNARWSLYNQMPAYLPDENLEWVALPADCFALSTDARNPVMAASQFVHVVYSQFGGHPTWIQDAEYPECPKCNNPMPFVAQLAGEEVEEFGEGMFYAFCCIGCKQACTTYQQS